MTTTPVVRLGSRPRSCVSRSRVDHAAAATRMTAASAKRDRRIRARQAAVGKAPDVVGVDAGHPPGRYPGQPTWHDRPRSRSRPASARRKREPAPRGQSSASMGGAAADHASGRAASQACDRPTRRSRAPRRRARAHGVDPRLRLPNRVLEQDERLLERTEHGLGPEAPAVEAAVRAHAEATPPPRARARRRPAPEQRRAGRRRGVRARGGTTRPEARRDRPATGADERRSF